MSLSLSAFGIILNMCFFINTTRYQYARFICCQLQCQQVCFTSKAFAQANQEFRRDVFQRTSAFLLTVSQPIVWSKWLWMWDKRRVDLLLCRSRGLKILRFKQRTYFSMICHCIRAGKQLRSKNLLSFTRILNTISFKRCYFGLCRSHKEEKQYQGESWALWELRTEAKTPHLAWQRSRNHSTSSKHPQTYSA